MSIFDDLKAEFPREKVSWRAQTMTRDGDKAMALAYIDARDVMERLDDVCGPENWQDRYEVHGAKTVCYLSIRIEDEWIVKADGAGDTAVEAEKGSISDAFKRAAVKWGIARYLYALPAQWVPCESYERNGKRYFKRFTADPWQRVPVKDADNDASAKTLSKAEARTIYEALQTALRSRLDDCTPAELSEWAKSQAEQINRLPSDWRDSFRAEFTEALNQLKEAA